MENKERPVIIIILLPSVCSLTELQLGLQLFTLLSWSNWSLFENVKAHGECHLCSCQACVMGGSVPR